MNTTTLVFTDRQQMLEQLAIPEGQPKHLKLPDGKIKVVITAFKSQMVMDTSPLLPQTKRHKASEDSSKPKIISNQKELGSKMVSSSELVLPKKYQLRQLSAGDKIEYWSKVRGRGKQKLYQLRTGVIVSVAGQKRFAVVRRFDDPSPKFGSAWRVDPRVIVTLTRNASMQTQDREKATSMARQYQAEINQIRGKDTATSRYWSHDSSSSEQDAESDSETSPQIPTAETEHYDVTDTTTNDDMREDLLL